MSIDIRGRKVIKSEIEDLEAVSHSSWGTRGFLYLEF